MGLGGDPERSDRIVAKLGTLWRATGQDQRFGQLLANYVYGDRLDAVLFYIDDGAIEDRLDAALAEAAQRDAIIDHVDGDAE